MRRYTGSPDDEKRLIDLSLHLIATGEIRTLFRPGAQSTTNFLSVVAQNPTFYEADMHGIWFIAWCAPFTARTLEVGCYIRPGKRQTKDAVAHILTTLCICFDHFKAVTVLGITRPNLIDLHKRLGYTFSGSIPIDDGHCEVLYLNKFNYQKLRTNHPLWKKFAYQVNYPSFNGG